MKPARALVALGMVAVLTASARAQDVALPDQPIPLGQLRPPELPPPSDGGPNAFVYSTDQAIELFQRRVARNGRDYVSFRILGEFFERRAEEKGDLADYERAELALRQSLKIAPGYDKAKVTLAAVLCSRHKFAEGLSLARELAAKEPGNLDIRATLGDALLELGQYPEAEAVYRELAKLGDAPPILARLANLAELKGDVDEAARLLATAEAKALKIGGDKLAAWYRVRLGDLAFANGRLEEAESRYRSVPSGTDPYHDATAALGKLRVGQGRLEEAVALYRKAVAIGPDPHMLAALGDLELKLGHDAEARALFDRVMAIAGDKPEYRRVVALFLADHDRDLPKALELAQLDFADRKDIHGADALAWCLFKNGRLDEAAKAMADALRLGTRESPLDDHAAWIAQARGDKAAARDHLARALARNSAFTIHADEARKRLADLEKELAPRP
jgi:tetratricopeptide (TPR) repeat protein